MNSIVLNHPQKKANNTAVAKPAQQSLIARYNNYVAQQEALKVYHYLVVIIIIPCVYMTTSIIAMAAMVDWFVYFIAFTMVLFFANVIVHIGEGKSKVFIPLFHITTFLFIAIPAITYLLTQL